MPLRAVATPAFAMPITLACSVMTDVSTVGVGVWLGVGVIVGGKGVFVQVGVLVGAGGGGGRGVLVGAGVGVGGCLITLIFTVGEETGPKTKSHTSNLTS